FSRDWSSDVCSSDLAAGGINAQPASGEAAELEQRARPPACVLACICGSDKRYAGEASGIARALKAAGIARVYLAGKPGEHEAQWREAGVDELIHVGVDVLASLEKAHAELGLRLCGPVRALGCSLRRSICRTRPTVAPRHANTIACPCHPCPTETHSSGSGRSDLCVSGAGPRRLRPEWLGHGAAIRAGGEPDAGAQQRAGRARAAQ